MAFLNLFTLCWNAITNFMRHVSLQFVHSDDYETEILPFEEMVAYLEVAFSALPTVFQRDVGKLCLSVANEVGAKYASDLPGEKLQQLKSQLVVRKLVSVAAVLKMKDLRFSDWSEPVQTSLLDYLWKMTCLETLHCDPQGRLEGAEQALADSLPFLTKLEFFLYKHECTDAMVSTLLANSRFLREISLKFPAELVNEKISALNAQLQLAVLQGLISPSLIVNTTADVTLNRFQDIFPMAYSCESPVKFNLCQDFALEFILMGMEDELGTTGLPFRPFRASSLSADLLTDSESGLLKLVPKYFPDLKELDLRGIFYSADASNLPLIDQLHSLQVFKLNWRAIDSDDLPSLLAIRCSALTSLCLDFEWTEEDINIAEFLGIGSRCPNLQSLKLCNVAFYKNNDFAAQETAFTRLQKFELEASSTSCVELILQHASGLESIRLTADEGLTDEFILGLLNLNPLKHLKEFYVSPKSRVSSAVLKLVTSNCR